MTSCICCGEKVKVVTSQEYYCWNVCNECLDIEHQDFVRTMAKENIYPYGKAYADKLEGVGK